MLAVINFAAFYAGWFACVLGAADGLYVLGPAVVAVLVAVHLFLTADPGREARLIFAVGALGFVIDTAQATLGVFSFGTHSFFPWLCPPWMVALWMIFATTLNGSMRWLAGRYVVAAVLGGIFGPLSYYYGVRLGAIEFRSNPAVSLGVLVVVWVVTMPGLLRLTASMRHSPLSNEVSSPESAA